MITSARFMARPLALALLLRQVCILKLNCPFYLFIKPGSIRYISSSSWRRPWCCEQPAKLCSGTTVQPGARPGEARGREDRCTPASPHRAPLLSGRQPSVDSISRKMLWPTQTQRGSGKSPLGCLSPVGRPSSWGWPGIFNSSCLPEPPGGLGKFHSSGYVPHP